jgi:non-ribosomal peptide synthetase component E (peptide arylation enzyme)
VILTPDASGLTLAEIAAWCRERGLMTQKIPEQLEIVDSLPYTPAGKVKKDELRNKYA